jgi:hypothetical protein
MIDALRETGLRKTQGSGGSKFIFCRMRQKMNLEPPDPDRAHYRAGLEQRRSALFAADDGPLAGMHHPVRTDQAEQAADCRSIGAH